MTGPRKHPGPQGPVRPQVAVRLSEGGIAEIDRRANLAGVKRSEMVRRMLTYAAQKMPDTPMGT